jgi:hypothetical protein
MQVFEIIEVLGKLRKVASDSTSDEGTGKPAL